jgi:hypothetical protein
MKSYFKLCTFRDSINPAIVMGILEEHDIPATIINKQDSNYVFLGENEVWVPEVFKKEAILLFENIQLN